jgi:hypothetical protein
MTGIPRMMVCSSKWSVGLIYQTANWAGICPSPPVAMIPALLTSPELRGVVVPVSHRIPDTTAMSNNRLGKYSLNDADSPSGKCGQE